LPGSGTGALESLGLRLEDARRRLVESMGDPFEPQELDPAIPMATKLLLERALLSAIELEDEELAGEHVLVALTEKSDSFAWQLGEGELDPSPVRDALVAVTDGMLPVSKPPPPTPRREAKRIPRPPEPELAPSPAGHDPRRRRPWGSAVFEIPGRPWSPANGQYYIDRDGHPTGPQSHPRGRQGGARHRGQGGHPRSCRDPRGVPSAVLSAGVAGWRTAAHRSVARYLGLESTHARPVWRAWMERSTLDPPIVAM
jgi:Clp amino terminal domain, pathogenicity island component